MRTAIVLYIAQSSQALWRISNTFTYKNFEVNIFLSGPMVQNF